MSDNWITAVQALNGATAERRREQRRYVKLPIEVELASGQRHSGVSRDLCPSSMGAVVSTDLKMDEDVWLTFTYPVASESSHQVSLQATVRQRLGFRYGFQFAAPLDV